jgi:nicotinate-nucleotide adenylyltransferase
VIGILGGTFDPIHYGHLRPALEVFETLGLAELRLIPAGVPPHRGRPTATTAQRLAMVQAAIDGLPGWRVDRRELDRPGLSYMVETLASLRSEIGTAPLVLLLGQDAYGVLDSWHQWTRILDLAHVVVMARPGSALPAAGVMGTVTAQRRVDAPAALRGHPAGRVYPCPVTQLAISGTAIRALVAAGRSPRFLLPDAVLALLHQWRLYG